MVSIITPAWQAERYIQDCIASVQAQTYPNWEMLVVDDCSTDATSDIVEAIAAIDNRVVLIRQTQNGGPAAARNAALKKAQGRWIAFLDSDDQWLPTKLAQQISFQAKAKAPLSFTQYHRLSADHSRQGHTIRVPTRLGYKNLLSNTAIATSTVLVDRHLTGDLHMKPIYYDDFGCWLDVLRDGGFAVGLQQDLMCYRVIDGSVSRNKWRSAMEVWKTYRNIERLSILRSLWHFTQYASNALIKYRKF